MKIYQQTATNKEQGFSLLEVLVSLIVISIGFLGLAALQATGLSFNHDAYVRTQGTNLASDIIERMRIDSANALLNTYSGTHSAENASATCAYNSATAADAITCWRVEIRDNLPSGSVSISNAGGTGLNEFTITISWQDKGRSGNSSQSWNVIL